MRIGIVIALDAEARTLPARPGGLLEHTQYQLAVCGPGPTRAACAARALLDSGCEALLSFGLAGGLDPKLRPAALIVANTVLCADGDQLPCAASLRDALRRRLVTRQPVMAALYGATEPIMTQADKRRLYNGLQVAAVDMESAAIGRVARDRSRPFAVLRCVVDPADFKVPRAALAGMAAEGGSRPLATAMALLRHPSELPDLIRLAVWYGAALRALRGAGALLYDDLQHNFDDGKSGDEQ